MDDEEFDRFYAGTAARLVGQLHAMTGDRAEAQDCVQEAFVRAWARRRRLDPDQNPEAWVRTTAYRISVSRWRRATSALRAHHRHGAPADLPGADEPGRDRDAVVAALRQLSAPQRQVVVLHYLCDLSVDQITSETGVPASTVKTRLFRGRKALAALLADTSHAEGARRG
ncbi:SigE family RNA polymerase sigma factor [Angustibacter speluncae]